MVEGMAKEMVHQSDQSRYALLIDGELASVVDYRINENQISFHHTYTAPNRRGQGLAGEIVEFAVNDVEATSERRIVPMCWYVGVWFDEHPERASLLSR
jgi:predicted GNAT family acetyltransferase